MDKTTRTLATYITSLNYQHLTPGALHETKRRLIDSIGCAIGGYTSEPVRIASRAAADASGTPVAHILCSGAPTSIEMAAFANTCMIRYLDCNDTYISVGSGHPSDMMGAVLAVADAHHASGADTLTAIAAAYEMFTAMADCVRLRDRGWDQGVFVVLGAAAGTAKLLRLSSEQTANALAIAVTANIPTRQTRAGELSMWKGCATAASAREGVFAALLAAKGMTGPTAAFEGKNGIMEQVTGPFELGRLGGEGVSFGIERTNVKFFPAEYHSQAPLWLALALREKVRAEDIEAIDIQTYFTAWSEIGSEPEKWEPKTRETADHSLPYLLSVALTDGFITPESFSDARIHDPATRKLMAKIRISENKAFTAQFPEKLVTQIEVTTRTGERLVETASYPKGHARNPMADEDIEAKFIGLAKGLVSEPAARDLIKTLWEVDHAVDISGTLAKIQLPR